MALKPADIDAGFRLILGRKPSDSDVANLARQCETEAALRTVLLNSEEFYRKFRTLRMDFEAKQTPVLVHAHIPGTLDDASLAALAAAPGLQPAERVGRSGFDEICTLPRPERLKLRYVQADILFSAAGALDLPFRILCVLRRPAARIHALYRAACAAAPDTPMDFATYLELSLDDPGLRLELDNGQVRRLAGATGEGGLGREAALLRHALHTALDPDTILGLAERPGALMQSLADETGTDPAEIAAIDGTDTPDDTALDADLARLPPETRSILDGYTGWDDYLYAVCEALLFPNSSAGET